MNDTDQNKSEVILLESTATIISAYVARHTVASQELPNLIGSVYSALRGGASNTAANMKAAEMPKQKPWTPIQKSIEPDYIICLEDGLKFKSLKRHLKASYNLTPQQYREKWDLPPDYPMVAPAYAAARSRLAKEMQLGRSSKAEKSIVE